MTNGGLLFSVWLKIITSNSKTQKRHQNFDYTIVTDRLEKVSWSNDSPLTGVYKPAETKLLGPSSSNFARMSHLMTRKASVLIARTYVKATTGKNGND